MSEAISSPYSSSHSYPCHVLFQFILASFLRTQEAFKNLKALRCELGNSSEIRNKMEHKNKLLSAIENLAGIASPFHNGFSLDLNLGLLTGLKNNSTLFQKNYSRQIPEASLIREQATSSWFHCIELNNLATHFSLELPLADHKDFLRFQKVEARMFAQLKKLGNTILKTLKHFKTNENVLLCLMHRQTQLDSIYGEAFTVKILKKLNLNTEKAYHFIIEAYKKRGFSDPTAVLKSKFSSSQSAL